MKHVRWEYRIVEPLVFRGDGGASDELHVGAVEEHLNELGAQGWELVATLPPCAFVFKRPAGARR